MSELPPKLSGNWELESSTQEKLFFKCVGCGLIKHAARSGAVGRSNKYSHLYKHARECAGPPSAHDPDTAGDITGLQTRNAQQDQSPNILNTPDHDPGLSEQAPIRFGVSTGHRDVIQPSSASSAQHGSHSNPQQQQMRSIQNNPALYTPHTPMSRADPDHVIIDSSLVIRSSALPAHGGQAVQRRLQLEDSSEPPEFSFNTPVPVRGVNLNSDRLHSPDEQLQLTNTGGGVGAPAGELTWLGLSETNQQPLAGAIVRPHATDVGARSGSIGSSTGMQQLAMQQLASPALPPSPHSAIPSEIQTAVARVGRSKVQAYIDHLPDPVDPRRPEGCTTAVAVHQLQQWRLDYKIPIAAYERLLHVLQHTILCDNKGQPNGPDANWLPPTRYIQDRLIGVPDIQRFEWHACECSRHIWPPFDREYKHLKDVTCPLCEGPRVRKHSVTGKYLPVRPLWYFGLEFAINNYFMANSEWAQYRGTPEARQNTFYTSKFADELREHPDCGAALDNTDNSAYGIGWDWFEPFTWKTHSVGLVVIRCLDLEDRYQGLKMNSFPIMIMSGPRQPPHLEPYVGLIARDFLSFGPHSDGITAHSMNPARTFTHKVILGAVNGDRPALDKVGGFSGHSSFLGCNWCVMNSTRCEGYQSAVGYWRGFDAPVPVNKQKVKDLGPDFTAVTGQPDVICTPEEIRRKGHLYLQNQPIRGPNPYGATGLCAFDALIPYFNMRDHFSIPTAHALGRGVGLNLWQYLINPEAFQPTKKQSTTIAEVVGDVVRGAVRRGKQMLRRGRVGRAVSRMMGMADRAGSPALQESSGGDSEPQVRRGRKRQRQQISAPVIEETVPSSSNVSGGFSGAATTGDATGSAQQSQTSRWFTGPILTRQQLSLIQKRGGNLKLNNDFDSPYVDVVKKKGKLQTVDQMLQLFDPIASLLLRDVQIADDEEFTQVVHAVNRACRWFNHPYIKHDQAEGSNYMEHLEQHSQSLYNLGKFVEKRNLPLKLLTSNMHMVCCRLKEQCLQRGHSGAEGELYIERTILRMKFFVRGRISQRPEKVMVNNLLLEQGVTGFGTGYECPTYEELTGRGQARELYGTETAKTRYDDLPEQQYLEHNRPGGWRGHKALHRFQGAGMKLGALVKMDEGTKQRLVGAVSSRLLWDAEHPNLSQWRVPANVVAPYTEVIASERGWDNVVLFNGLMFRMDTTYLSVAHKREVSKESYWALVALGRHHNRDTTPCVAKIHRYVFCRLQAAQDDVDEDEEVLQPFPIRLALVTGYQTTVTQNYGNTLYRVDTDRPVRFKGPEATNLEVTQKPGSNPVPVQPINVDLLAGKLIYVPDDDEPAVKWFAKSTTATGRGYG